jgi:hypothetical protein
VTSQLVRASVDLQADSPPPRQRFYDRLGRLRAPVVEDLNEEQIEAATLLVEERLPPRGRPGSEPAPELFRPHDESVPHRRTSFAMTPHPSEKGGQPAGRTLSVVKRRGPFLVRQFAREFGGAGLFEKFAEAAFLGFEHLEFAETTQAFLQKATEPGVTLEERQGLLPQMLLVLERASAPSECRPVADQGHP